MRTYSLFALLANAVTVLSLDNGLGLVPQMGWNSWNTFQCDIDASVILDTAHLIKHYHLEKYGYDYLIIDDCWSLKERNASGYLQSDPIKFPMGMKALSDEIHDLGLKFGMYSDAGKYTCAGYPGSLGHEEKDANLFASWGVDYLKYDNCYNEGQSGTPNLSYNRFKIMSDALNATGRPIFYSMCNWGEDAVWNWASTIANSWRISGDITDSFSASHEWCPCETYLCNELPGVRCSILNILNKASPLSQKSSRPYPLGGFNDLDMLEVGRPGLNFEEAKAHFTLWAMMRSPLIMGHDLSTMTDSTLGILTNQDVIDLNQGPGWKSATRTVNEATFQVWEQRRVSKDEHELVVCLLNTGMGDMKISAKLPDQHGTWETKDLWSGEKLGEAKSYITATVPEHGVTVVKLTKVEKEDL